MKKKIAIIGASYLQEPLIRKAKSEGIETHVFAWATGDIGEKSADYFYPISITEKERILAKCREIGVDGVCTIASDLATITVGYVANGMGLIGNSMETVAITTNKHLMRQRFENNNDPSPRSIQVSSINDLEGFELEYPIIVKPVDRSGSRGITKLENPKGLEEAIERAIEQGFEKHALVEEFAIGQEYSVEYISWRGKHIFLALTKKYTTGAPDFIETGHFEPAPVEDYMLEKIKSVISHALDSLGIEYGASHSEIKISDDGDIKIIEIGARMGGDFIGSSLVQISTGYDFIQGVIDVALGKKPIVKKHKAEIAAIRFVFDEEDVKCFDILKNEHPEMLVAFDIKPITGKKVTDSSSRFGYYIFKGNDRKTVEKYLPVSTEY